MSQRARPNRRQFIGFTAAGLTGSALAPKAGAAGTARYAVAPPSLPSLPIVGSRERFPVRRIYCMGLNYPTHAKDSTEKGFSAPPFYFLKSNDMIVQNGSTVDYPLLTHDYQYELEMVVALKSGGTNIPKEQTLACVYGYAVGLDMTRRDLQTDGMNNRMPWEPGKSFEQCAPCSAISPVTSVGHVDKGRIQLNVNGEIHQDADVSEMIYDVPAIISFLSKSIKLGPGDLIYTGTPRGTGPVVPGDHMIGTIDKLGTLAITVG